MALAIIFVLYASIGVLAAAGSITISRRLFAGPRERVFYGLFLVLIAAFYLAFTAYFDGTGTTWLAEIVLASGFALLGLLGCARTGLLAAGYLLHGLWDLLHELPASGLPLTEIPLAYGVFCAAFDWCVAAYCVRRHRAWVVPVADLE
ncbi:DUF6010 family protein [Microbulbifer yueqingensis]|uniref:Uncharacterized protein n=1 Tax=Microbulbifer yueqingensis TaxID=658219 RepID=A0A1G9DXU8_9GAMM|nr:DUF6010 family protein [Microbulbifer yueqingensis]SDK68678.1 hypothetical protein SAMN05216212_2937 [Microbulbifer yueqingensis]